MAANFDHAANAASVSPRAYSQLWQAQEGPHSTSGLLAPVQIASQRWVPHINSALPQDSSTALQLNAHGPSEQTTFMSLHASFPSQETLQANRAGHSSVTTPQLTSPEQIRAHGAPAGQRMMSSLQASLPLQTRPQTPLMQVSHPAGQELATAGVVPHVAPPL